MQHTAFDPDCPKVLLVGDPWPEFSEAQRYLEELSEWDTHVAHGVEEAKARVAAEPFDLVAVGLDAYEDNRVVLELVRAHAPATVRVLLNDPLGALVPQAMDLAHQILVRPWNGATIEVTVDRAFGGPGLVTDARILALVGTGRPIPCLPASTLQLVAMLGDSNSSTDEIARLVSSEPAICAKVLQLANSAAFGARRQITSINQAVVTLGTAVLRVLTLAGAAFAAIPGVPESQVAQVRDYSMKNAQLARLIARGKSDDAFCAAVLQDIGQLLLLSRLGDEYGQVLAEAATTGQSLDAVELKRLGVSHAHAGAWLLQAWGIPSAIVEAVAFSHTRYPHPGRGLDALSISFVAAAMTQAVVDGKSMPDLDHDWLVEMGIDGEIQDWMAKAEKVATARAA